MESDLLSAQGHQAEPSYFNECIARGIFSTPESLTTYIKQYVKHNLYREDTSADLVSTVLQTNTLTLPMVGDMTDELDDVIAARTMRRAEELRTEFAASASATMNEEQQAAVDNLLNNPVGLHAINGGPGTGKSFIIRYITHRLREKGLNVSLGATTATAASRIGRTAITAHSLFDIPVRGCSRPLHPGSDTMPL